MICALYPYYTVTSHYYLVFFFLLFILFPMTGNPGLFHDSQVNFTKMGLKFNQNQNTLRKSCGYSCSKTKY